MPNPKLPTLLALDAQNIPQKLTESPRWALWKAVWNEKRGKYDKIPYNPQDVRLSTKRHETWMTYEVACNAYAKNPSRFAGIGYLMTGANGVVGIDLDRCVSPDGTVADWAKDIVQKVGSYAERSPSGNGLRIFTEGEIEADWTNHDMGIEVYAGHTARFLTVTGQRLEDAPVAVSPAPEHLLADLSARYAREREAAAVISLNMPDLIPPVLLPDLDALDLPYYTRDFLRDGTCRSDRSAEIFATAIALYQAGLDEAEVFSALAQHPVVIDIALDKRNQDYERALLYLWVEHAQKGKGKAPRVATLDDFDVLPEAIDAQGKLKAKFAFQQVALYTKRKAVSWAIKNVLPMAEMGVVYGESGAGKSFFTLDLVLAVARGIEWRGHKVAQGTVAYVCAEGAGGFSLRVQAYAQYHGVDLSTVPLHILGAAPNLMEVSDTKELASAVKSLGPVSIVVVDTLAQVTPGADENSGKDMGRVLSHCAALHKATGAMILLVAHAGKDASRGQRGWSGLKAPMDVQIQVDRAGDYRSATLVKLKDGMGEGAEYAFKLPSVTLGEDEDGDAITSCVVQSEGALPKAKRRGEPKGAVQQVVMRVAQTLTDMPGAVTTQQLIEACVLELPHDDTKRDRRRDLVTRAMADLAATNLLSVADGVVAVR